MPRYSVTICQDRTETTQIEVDAADPGEAQDKALQIARATGYMLEWEPSDGANCDPYIGDEEEAAELIEEDPCPVNRRPKSTCPEGCDHGG